MAITSSDQIFNVFQGGRMRRSDTGRWPKGGIRVLILCLLAALLAGAALRGGTPARAATVIDVPCGTPIHVTGNDITVRLQPCTYPSLYFGGFPGTLEGNGATIDLSNSAYAATILGTDVTVRDIRVTNSQQRGGIFTPGSKVTLERVVVSGNRSTIDPGGGIVSSDGMKNLTLIDCTISDNVGRYGAGLWVHPDFSGGVIRILRSTISGNHAVATLNDSVSGIGGGVYVEYVQQNSVTLEITNSTISGNVADRIGGAMYLTGKLTAAINDTTITGNSAGQDSDAICDETGGMPNSGPMLRRSIIAGNGLDSVPDCGGSYSDFKHDYGYNVIVGTCVGALGPESTTKIVTSNGAMLSDLANNGGLTKTHLPLAGSPVFNMIPVGSPGCTPGSTDQRGVSRPQSTGCDSGSVESKGAINRPPTIAGAALTRTVGSPASNSQIASVDDPEEANTSLTVTVNDAASATVNGITVSNISINTSGQVTASVVANCAAAAAKFKLRVTDSGGLFAEAALSVTVNSNPLPTLGTYPATSVTTGGAITVMPSVVPSDNGSVVTLTASAPGFTGTLVGNPATGTITVTNVNSPGNYTVNVTATDNCGARTNRTFTLSVTSASNCGVVISPVTIKQPYLAVPYVELLSAAPAGTYTYSVSAGKLPTGLQLVQFSNVMTITGTPTTPGTFNFTIKVKWNNGTCEGSRSYTVTIPPTIVPILECVQRGVNGVYTARFGYNNTTGSAVTIYMGGDNYITPGNQYQGQPIVFQPGRVVSAFSISFARIDSDTLGSWYLKGPDNVVRQVNALTSSPSCP